MKEYPPFFFERIKPDWRCSPVERYISKTSGRRRTVRVRTQMFKFAISNDDLRISPPEGMTANSYFHDGLFIVPGYVRASSQVLIYGKLIFLGNEPFAFKTHSCIGGYYNSFDYLPMMNAGSIVFFNKTWYGARYNQHVLDRFYRFYEFPINDAGPFDEWKENRMMRQPQYWKVEIVKELKRFYYGPCCMARIAYNMGEQKSRAEREAVAISCLRQANTSRENQRQLRALGFVA